MSDKAKKLCRTCKKYIPTEYFSICRKAADGLQSSCRVCLRIYCCRRRRLLKQAAASYVRQPDIEISYIMENVEMVPESGCWIWMRAVDVNGYGRAVHPVTGEDFLAHRLSWVAHYGEIQNCLFVLHKCDVPSCVRPDHMFLGGQAENMRDMADKGRAFCGPGEKHPFAKLKWESVREIRKVYSSGCCTQVSLATRFNVAETTIRHILAQRTWRE